MLNFKYLFIPVFLALTACGEIRRNDKVMVQCPSLSLMATGVLKSGYNTAFYELYIEQENGSVTIRVPVDFCILRKDEYK